MLEVGVLQVAVRSNSFLAFPYTSERYRTLGYFRRVDSLTNDPSPFGHGGVEATVFHTEAGDAIVHLRGCEQALEPGGWTGRQGEWIACLFDSWVCPFDLQVRVTGNARAVRAARAGLGTQPPRRPCSASEGSDGLAVPMPAPSARWTGSTGAGMSVLRRRRAREAQAGVRRAREHAEEADAAR